MRTAPKFSDGHQPTTSLNTSDTTKRQQKSLANYSKLLTGYRLTGAGSLALQRRRPSMWPGAPRSMPDGSFLARAASALSVRPHVASRLSILCSTNCSTNSPSGVCRRHDRFEPSPFSRSRRRKGRGEARGAGAGHSRRGCVPASPVVGVRRQPPARVPFGSAGRADVRTARPLAFGVHTEPIRDV